MSENNTPIDLICKIEKMAQHIDNATMKAGILKLCDDINSCHDANDKFCFKADLLLLANKHIDSDPDEKIKKVLTRISKWLVKDMTDNNVYYHNQDTIGDGVLVTKMVFDLPEGETPTMKETLKYGVSINGNMIRQQEVCMSYPKKAPTPPTPDQTIPTNPIQPDPKKGCVKNVCANVKKIAHKIGYGNSIIITAIILLTLYSFLSGSCTANEEADTVVNQDKEEDAIEVVVEPPAQPVVTPPPVKEEVRPKKVTVSKDKLLEIQTKYAKFQSATLKWNDVAGDTWRWDSWDRARQAEALEEWYDAYCSLYIYTKGVNLNASEESKKLFAYAATMIYLADANSISKGKALNEIAEQSWKEVYIILSATNNVPNRVLKEIAKSL